MAAVELFMSHDVKSAPVAEICRAAGVSNGSFFHHFPSKDGLALEITLALRREYWDFVPAAMEPCTNAMDGIAGAIRAAFAHQRQFPNRYRLSRSDDAPWMRGHDERIGNDNAPYRNRAARWIAARAGDGEVPLLLPEIYGALLFGMPHWVARNANAGATPTDFDAAENSWC